MSQFEDLPFEVFDFHFLVRCTQLSKTCRALALHGLACKERGRGLLCYLATIDMDRRIYKIANKMTCDDLWDMWKCIASTHNGIAVLLKLAPLTIYMTTEYRCETLGVCSSGNQAIEVMYPYNFMHSMSDIVHGDIAYGAGQIGHIVDLLTAYTSGCYMDITWQTSPCTFYQVNAVEKRAYVYYGVVVNYTYPLCITYRIGICLEMDDLTELHQHLAAVACYF